MKNFVASDRLTVKTKAIKQEKHRPKRFVKLENGNWFIDFGRAYFAGLELEFKSPEAGRIITVHLGEALSVSGGVNRSPGASIRYQKSEFTLKEGQLLYAVPLPARDARLMPDNIGPVMPFRYAEVENAPELRPEDIRQVAAFYPFDENAATFTCSDKRINAIWEMCKHTMKATSFCGIFVDGDRERLPYEADAYINQLGWYCCTDDVTLPRYTHESLILRACWPTEWIMFSVFMAWEDYLYTGDISSVKEFYPDLKAKTLYALRRADGLISTVEPAMPKEVERAVHFDSAGWGSVIHDIVDWPAAERDGYDMRPVNTVVNAFHCRALELMAKIAKAVKEPEDELLFKAAFETAVKSLNEKLFDKKTRLFVDGEGSTHSSLHSNMFPLVFGLIPEERREKVTEFISTRGMACSVYGAQFLMEALFDNGKASQAMSLMTADTDRSWTHMIERVGTTIALEAWDNKYKPNQDWNHAWGAAPANILPRKILGIEPLEPGFKKILIWPRPGNLTGAFGIVPTAMGRVSVKYERTVKMFKILVEIPAGTTARVVVPYIQGGTLTLDGKAVKGIIDNSRISIEPVKTGKHEIVVC
ncbi:MAG: alpha-L-rhamnosidase C-terminal domain-containing protein [Candidatus Firestonebacteria bacterium]